MDDISPYRIKLSNKVAFIELFIHLLIYPSIGFCNCNNIDYLTKVKVGGYIYDT